MNIYLGSVLILFGLTGWVGRVICALSPQRGERLGLIECEADCDPAFYADVRSEVTWDAFVIWTLPLAGLLMILDHTWWPVFGLIGGGTYFYLAGRGIALRAVLDRRNIRTGAAQMLSAYYIIHGMWGVVALVTLAIAATALVQGGALN